MHVQTYADAYAGTYSVEGVDAHGQPYAGTMRLELKGIFLHADADLGPRGNRYGLAMPFKDRLVMAFGARDLVEIGAYDLRGDQVHGMWVPPGAADEDLSKCGREESVVESPGVWRIRQAKAVDGSAYTGVVRLTPAKGASFENPPTPVVMTWSLHDGEYGSFGLAYSNAVYSTFNLSKDEPRHGVAAYEVRQNLLVGRWLEAGAAVTGSETLTRQ
jgi:hypothetical protein